MSFSHPILSCEEANAYEKDLLRSESAAWTAMNRAGRSLGRAVLEDYKEIGRFPERASILVLLGKGHNGGDALLAADEILSVYPRVEVSVLTAQPIEDCRTLTRRAMEGLQKSGAVSVVTLTKVLNNAYTLCLDGLLGMNFRPPLSSLFDSIIEAINGHSRISFKAAVDLPSGIGGQAFKANFTYATGIAKTPLFDPANAVFVGRIRYLDIGFFDGNVHKEFSSGETILLPKVLDSLRGLRPASADKRSFGHLLLLSGSRSMPGAMLMNVKAALRSGVGLVTVFAPESVASYFAAAVPEAMWVPMPETPDGGIALEGRHLILKKARRGTAFLSGSGLGREPETHQLLKDILDVLPLPTVLDADALMPDIIKAKRPSSAGPLIITPHAGEFQRLSARNTAAYEPKMLKNYCSENRLTSVFKGPINHISDGASLSHATFGGPVLSRGGSGDILAGLCAGLLAQRPDEGYRVACLATVWHGLAASRLAQLHGSQAVTTTDLLDHLGPVLRHE